ncbi:TIGR04255 family protein [Flavobacterium sp. W20_MBD1_R3]|uniref:TIGR04255 family protein n=1 Tax=Flavobacterium sp. W20_MBD1_R3 TaxID=3240278 RepID=UPI003F8F92E6
MVYKNAPIREAIFDIKIEELDVSYIAKIESLHDFVIEKYPIKEKRISFNGQIKVVGEEVLTPFNSSIDGFIFKSKDGKQMVQMRLDGFTFNLVDQYSDWDSFSIEAFRLFDVYLRELKPKKISRIALRFVNRIGIPQPFTRFQDYIVNMPPIPACLPQAYSNFFMRIEVPCDEDGTFVILTETIEPSTGEFLPFILDIDSVKVANIGKDKELLKVEFEKLRKLKNITFENCITDNTRRLFN